MALPSFIGGSPAIGGSGSGFGDESSDLLQSRAHVGDVSLASPFTFTGSGTAAVGGGGVPLWLVAAGLAAAVGFAVLRKRGR